MNVLVDNNNNNNIIPNIISTNTIRHNRHHIRDRRHNSRHIIIETNTTTIKGAEQTTISSNITNRETKAISAKNRRCVSKSWRDSGSRKESVAIANGKGIPVVVVVTIAMIGEVIVVTLIIIITTTAVTTATTGQIITIANAVVTTTVNSAVATEDDVMKGDLRINPEIDRTVKNRQTIDKGFVFTLFFNSLKSVSKVFIFLFPKVFCRDAFCCCFVVFFWLKSCCFFWLKSFELTPNLIIYYFNILIVLYCNVIMLLFISLPFFSFFFYREKSARNPPREAVLMTAAVIIPKTKIATTRPAPMLEIEFLSVSSHPICQNANWSKWCSQWETSRYG